MACPPRRTERPPCTGWFAGCTVLVALVLTGGQAAEPALTPLVDDVPALTSLATPANGQTVYCLDGESAAVIALDPRAPDKRRTALAASGAGPRPQAIACLDSSTLAALCAEGHAWSLRTWRVQPDRAADPATPLQAVPLGTANEPTTTTPWLVVGRGREWLAVVGLPAPLPPVLRLPIAGARLGAASDRGCPKLAAGTRAAAAAASPADALVIVTSSARAPGDAGGDIVTYYSAAGRPLLALDTGLQGVRAAAFGRADGALWVLAEAPAPGLWRLDAVFAAGRQAIRGSHAARLAAAADLVSLDDRTVAVLAGPTDRRLVRLDLDPTENAGP
jgi:hypothetical protein